MSMKNLVRIENVEVASPLLNQAVADSFRQLRQEVLKQSGIDFLARLGDCFRALGYSSGKPGVAFKSWHKAGRALDLDQGGPLLRVIEPQGGAVFWRLYPRCARQDGSLGTQMTIRPWLYSSRDRDAAGRFTGGHSGEPVSGYFVNFTRLAGEYRWERIPAQRGWPGNSRTAAALWNRQEFWHFQRTDGLTWEEAISQVYTEDQLAAAGVHPVTLAHPSWLMEGSRGAEVAELQRQLQVLGYDPGAPDGIFGPATRAAVEAFQRAKALDPDGIVGPKTRAAIARALSG